MQIDFKKDFFGFTECRLLTNDSADGYQKNQVFSGFMDGKEYIIKIILNLKKYCENLEEKDYASNFEWKVLQLFNNDEDLNKNVPKLYEVYRNVKLEDISDKYFSIDKTQILEDNLTIIVCEKVVGSLCDYCTELNKATDPVKEWFSFIYVVLHLVRTYQRKYKIIHNDLNTSNVLIKRGKFVLNEKVQLETIFPVLWDFELSQVYDEQTREKYGFPKENACVYEKDELLGDDQDEDPFDMPINSFFNTFSDVHYILRCLNDEIFRAVPKQVLDFIEEIYGKDDFNCLGNNSFDEEAYEPYESGSDCSSEFFIEDDFGKEFPHGYFLTNDSFLGITTLKYLQDNNESHKRLLEIDEILEKILEKIQNIKHEK